jgi:hypothetical protein
MQYKVVYFFYFLFFDCKLQSKEQSPIISSKMYICIHERTERNLSLHIHI